ncbi:hypothetical protein KP509_04G076000 [Ceratopteris richardii]|uniref:Uncharacterized protein n=1 Tax=Ceratopteris richardii TaxID=49495 RepID=A0A8T2UYJ2_CERRI|nr:hypothetical protein KP509_04G076000 [Ceratopteris richardii]
MHLYLWVTTHDLYLYSLSLSLSLSARLMNFVSISKALNISTPSKHPGLPKWHSLASHSVARVITTLVGCLFDSQRLMRTLLVNKTGCSVVLRSKFRNIWEGTPLTLSAGDQAFLLCTPQLPHQRVGVFLYDPLSLSSEAQQRCHHRLPPPLLIGQHTLAENKEFVLIRTPSHNHIFLSLLYPRANNP